MRTTIILALAGSLAGATALAHGGATGIVKERMDAMLAMGKGVKALSPMMRGQAEFDPDAVRAFAEEVRGHAGEAMTTLFPEGSGGMPSEAKPTVWTDWEAFAALAEELEVRAEGLALAAANPPSDGAPGGGAAMMGGGAAMMGGGASMMGGGAATMGGGASMMGGSAMTGGGGGMDAEAIGAMPVDRAFAMVAQTCSACHTRFRAESD